MKKGFSLIELLIVLVVVGVLVLISMPAIRSYEPTMQLSGATRELISDIRYAQQLSVTEQIEYGIRFFSLSDEYQIIKHNPEEEIIQVKYLPDQVSFGQITEFIEDELKFNPYGAVREPGTIILINTKSVIKTIDVRASGFVKLLN